MRINNLSDLMKYHKVVSVRGAADERNLKRAVGKVYPLNVDAFKHFVRVTTEDGVLVGMIPFPFESERYQAKLDAFI